MICTFLLVSRQRYSLSENQREEPVNIFFEVRVARWSKSEIVVKVKGQFENLSGSEISPETD